MSGIDIEQPKAIKTTCSKTKKVHIKVLFFLFFGTFRSVGIAVFPSFSCSFWYNKGIKNRREKPCQTVPKISSCVRELKDMITDLKQMIKMLQATVDAANRREEAFIQERDNLKDEIALLRKKLFGSSSEKSPVDFPG